MRLEAHPNLLKITDFVGLTNPVERYEREMNEWHARAVQPKLDRAYDVFLESLQGHIRNRTTPQTGIASYLLAKHSDDPSTLYNGYAITPPSSDWRVAEPTTQGYVGSGESSEEADDALGQTYRLDDTRTTREVSEDGTVVEKYQGEGWTATATRRDTRRFSSGELDQAAGE